MSPDGRPRAQRRLDVDQASPTFTPGGQPAFNNPALPPNTAENAGRTHRIPLTEEEQAIVNGAMDGDSSD